MSPPPLASSSVVGLLDDPSVRSFTAGSSFVVEPAFAEAPSASAPVVEAGATDEIVIAPGTFAVPKVGRDGGSYTMAKIGIFMPDGDLDGLDDGTSLEFAFGWDLLPFLSLEAAVGYLTVDGRSGGTQFDMWAIPAFVNGRVSLPVLFFEPYAGVGIGGVYADYEVGVLSSRDDFVAAMNAFVGVEVGLGGLAVGAEYKYLKTDDTQDDFAIEGGTVSLFGRLPF